MSDRLCNHMDLMPSWSSLLGSGSDGLQGVGLAWWCSLTTVTIGAVVLAACFSFSRFRQASRFLNRAPVHVEVELLR
jgi:hypothetical protein